MQLTDRCKRRADDDETPLRQTFDEECKSAGHTGLKQYSFD